MGLALDTNKTNHAKMSHRLIIVSRYRILRYNYDIVKTEIIQYVLLSPSDTTLVTFLPYPFLPSASCNMVRFTD